VSLWLVAPDAPGLSVRDYRLVDGSAACELRLQGVTGAERLAGGGERLFEAFDTARLAACAEMVGVMSALLDATLEHLRTRHQFGQPLGAFQVLQHRAAELYASLEQSRSQLYRAGLAAPAEAPVVIAGAKAFISAAAVRLGEACIQLHGGMGISDELAIGHGHKRILLLASLLGDSDSELERYLKLAG
jgi:alkylation response protein AidB-like acyl-CoA dehydrogenase